MQRCELGACVWPDRCEGGVEPLEEVCDGRDEDCDLLIDEAVCP